MSNQYRILVHFDAEQDQFVARAPEFRDCRAAASTRAEALALVEEEISQRLETMQKEGASLPDALVGGCDPADVTLSLSGPLYRDLQALANEAGVKLEAFLTEQLARLAAVGLVARQRSRAEHGDRGQRGGRRGGGRYHDIMGNRADFIEYVRGLEQGGSGGGRGHKRRGR